MAQRAPFDFVFDYLPTGITVKRMFGMHYIYWGKRILMILRKSQKEPEWNGVWIATSRDHHETLKAIVPELDAFYLDEYDRHSNWLLLKDDADDFEGPAIKVCELIAHGDPRIGKVTEKPPL
jgi:hypothetical protein